MTNVWPTPAPEPVVMTEEERNAKIRAWLDKRSELETVKPAEMELRKEVSAACFPNPTKGTQRLDLGGGYKLKLVHKVNYSLGISKEVDPNAPSIDEQCSELDAAIAKLGNEGAFLAERLLKRKWELSGSEYEKLDPQNPTHVQIKELIDALLTTSSGSPTLEFEAPKVA